MRMLRLCRLERWSGKMNMLLLCTLLVYMMLQYCNISQQLFPASSVLSSLRYPFVDSNLPTQAQASSLHMDRPLAIIFTSFSNRTDKLFVYSNTIRNWASFLPHIQPVLFTTFSHGPVLDLARKHGWYIHVNPIMNQFGSPVLKEMYIAAYKLYNVTFYGYANGDILFDMGLNATLSKMRQHTSTIKTCLLFGIRRNYNMLPEVNYTNNPLWPPRIVAELSHTNYSTWFRHSAFDYFFVSQHYPFQHIKPLVIGRSGFDTYFAAMNSYLKLSSIDGTGAITALHQTDKDGNFAHKAYADKLYNRELIGKDFNDHPGWAEHANYGAERTGTGSVVLKCRKCPIDLI